MHPLRVPSIAKEVCLEGAYRLPLGCYFVHRVDLVTLIHALSHDILIVSIKG